MCRLLGLTAGREPVSASFWLPDAPDSLEVPSRRNAGAGPNIDTRSPAYSPGRAEGRRAGAAHPRAAPGGTRPAPAVGAEIPRGRWS